ncbi:entericidin [Agrobacterium vitis]|uniref:Entericidin n=1 Tax=Agrobacterium vitis TaxID=373 RepID=A0A109CX38_AGRVI|nr:entericidin [Agrobacterium vitis]KAA3509046.1 entericidin [Agrobacterium vitis]KAA3526603.1 entericidin [Agrobacterium vitis]MCE6073556.1 entericidin [Agrobacterium vitis]MCF1453571.1 entericidin [Agrobacterium vitis]MCF1468364.1 entericidin [Agrobacterium vitis]
MNTKKLAAVAALFVAAAALSSCGNTIRGMGKDTANTVNATQSAGNSVAKAAK